MSMANSAQNSTFVSKLIEKLQLISNTSNVAQNNQSVEKESMESIQVRL